MRLRILVPLAAPRPALAAAPAGGDVSGRKAAVDARLQRVQAKIAWAQERERTLATEIASVNGQIRDLASQVGVVSAQLEPLEHDLRLHKEKLERLNELFRLQTSRYRFYRSEYSALIERLGNRLVDLYEQGEPSSLEVLFAAKSFDDLVEQANVADSLATQDKSIAGQVGTARERVRVQREHTKKFRSLVAAELRSEEHTSELQSLRHLVCRLLLE